MSHARITEVSSPPEYASTTFFTFSNVVSSLSSMWNQRLEDRHLHEHPVLGLVEDRRPRPLEDLVGNLLAAVRGKAVHDDRVPPRRPHERPVDPVTAEGRQPPPPLLFLP